MMKLLLLVAAFFYGAFALTRLRARWMGRIAAVLPPPRDFAVTIDSTGGRGGSVSYREKTNECRFGWTLEDRGKPVLYVMVPTPVAWDLELPWARGRRQQVLARIAEEVVRQKCPRCRWEMDDEGIHFHTS